MRRFYRALRNRGARQVALRASARVRNVTTRAALHSRELWRGIDFCFRPATKSLFRRRPILAIAPYTSPRRSKYVAEANLGGTRTNGSALVRSGNWIMAR